MDDKPSFRYDVDITGKKASERLFLIRKLKAFGVSL